MKKLSILIAVLVLALSLSLGVVCIGSFLDNDALPVQEVYVVRAEDSADGYATIYKTENEPLRILDLTDPQTKHPINNYETDYGGSNANTFVFIERMVKATSPDLVIITGDLVMSMFVSNVAPTARYLELFEELGVYWAPTFGNHDSESLYLSGTPDRDNLPILQNGKEYIVNLMSSYSHCLISAGDAGEGGGVGNYFINVREQGSNDIVYTLCMMDCVSDFENNSYYRQKTEAQVEWYERHINAISDLQFGEDRAENEVVKSLVFTHVAVPEIYEAYELAWNGGEPTSDYFWGHRLEGKVNNAAYASCTMFESVLELGSTTAMFFGHHHDNDFRVKYQGVDLVYGQHSGLSHYYRMDADADAKTIDMSDIFTYGDERGGVLITIEDENTYTIEQKLAVNTIEYNDIKIDYYEVANDLASRGWEVSGVPEE